MKEPRLAIVSCNRRKYSETFIHSHLDYLSHHPLYLFEGYLPSMYSLDKLQTEHVIQKRSFWKRTITNEEAIEALVRKENITVMLAEYGPSGVEMMNIAERMGIPLIVHFHGYDAYRKDILETYGTRYKELFQKAAAVIAVSKDMELQLKNLGCPSGKIRQITYGINEALFSRIEHQRKSEFRFVSCGRFVAKKAPEITLEAFAGVHAEYPETLLTMIGDGPLLDACRQLAVKFKIQDKVTFTGPCSQLQTAEIFKASDCFVQHSRKDENNDSEGTPLAILEAGAGGLPVVATFHAGIPDIIQDGIHGFLVPEGDIQAMKKRMIRIIQQPAEATRIAENFKSRVHEKYSMNVYISQLKQLIQNVALK